MITKQRFLSMSVLMVAVASIGVMTTLLSSTYAQEQAYKATLGGRTKSHLIIPLRKGGHGLSQRMIVYLTR